MKRNDKSSSEQTERAFPVFKNYPINTKRKKVNLEQHYVVPWEMNDDESENNSL